MNIKETDHSANLDEATRTAMKTPAGGSDWSVILGETHADHVGMIEAKGWETVGDALTSYRHLEQHLGKVKLTIPAENADEADWQAIWDRLGRPATPDEYGFAAPENEGAIDYSPELSGWFRQAAHQAGLSDRQARSLHDSFLGQVQDWHQAGPVSGDGSGPASGLETGDGSAPVPGNAPGPDETTSSAEQQGDSATVSSSHLQQQAHDLAGELQQAWGRDYPVRLASARRAAQRFGDEAMLAQLETGLGAVPMMSLFARIGEGMGEASLISETNGEAGGFGMSRDSARAEIARIRGDSLRDSLHPLSDPAHPERPHLMGRLKRLYQIAYA